MSQSAYRGANARTRVSRIAAGAAAAVATGAMVAGGLLFSPVAPVSQAHAEQLPADSVRSTESVRITDSVKQPDCVVESAELQWGLFTRFRNYISGSIANGGWETENGATYETPAFSWANGTGAFPADLSAGAVAFTGDIHFTGHNDAMRLDLSDPEITFTGDDSAQLSFGVGAATDAETEIVYERVNMAKVDLAGYEVSDGTSFSISDATVRLTADGAAAMNNEFGDYIAGQEVDALALNMTVSGCVLPASTGQQEASVDASGDSSGAGDAAGETGETGESGEASEVETAEDSNQIPMLPLAIGGVALLVILVTSGILMAGRIRAGDAGSAGARDGGDGGGSAAGAMGGAGADDSGYDPGSADGGGGAGGGDGGGGGGGGGD